MFLALSKWEKKSTSNLFFVGASRNAFKTCIVLDAETALSDAPKKMVSESVH